MPKCRIIPLFIPHAGCPNQCVFCDQRKISGAGTPVMPEQVVAEIEKGLLHAGVGCELAFYGGSFTAMDMEVQRGLLAAAQPFVESGAAARIRLSTRPDAVSPEICAMLREYGVSTVELGCQSMDEGVLKKSRRGHTPKDTKNAVACLKEWGFSVILQMMTGLPGDDGSQSAETAKQLIALQPDGVRIYPTVVLRGTELEAMMHTGKYTPQTVEAAVELCASLYEMFRERHIPVIRVGLNPTEDLSGGEVVAGAYHPALGELVLSELYRRWAERMLREAGPGSDVILEVHPSRVSVMVGQHKRNFLDLKRRFSLNTLKIQGGNRDLWEICLKKP